MSPPRTPKSGLNYRTWIKSEARRAVANYKKSTTSPSSANQKSLMRLRARAIRAVTASRQYNNATFNRDVARVKKMMKEIVNYEARRRYKLVRQPNGSYSLARRN